MMTAERSLLNVLALALIAVSMLAGVADAAHESNSAALRGTSRLFPRTTRAPRLSSGVTLRRRRGRVQPETETQEPDSKKRKHSNKKRKHPKRRNHSSRRKNTAEKPKDKREETHRNDADQAMTAPAGKFRSGLKNEELDAMICQFAMYHHEATSTLCADPQLAHLQKKVGYNRAPAVEVSKAGDPRVNGWYHQLGDNERPEWLTAGECGPNSATHCRKCEANVTHEDEACRRCGEKRDVAGLPAGWGAYYPICYEKDDDKNMILMAHSGFLDMGGKWFFQHHSDEWENKGGCGIGIPKRCNLYHVQAPLTYSGLAKARWGTCFHGKHPVPTLRVVNEAGKACEADSSDRCPKCKGRGIRRSKIDRDPRSSRFGHPKTCTKCGGSGTDQMKK